MPPSVQEMGSINVDSFCEDRVIVPCRSHGHHTAQRRVSPSAACGGPRGWRLWHAAFDGIAAPVYKIIDIHQKARSHTHVHHVRSPNNLESAHLAQVWPPDRPMTVYYVPIRAARPCAPVRPPLKEHRTPPHAPRALDIDSRQGRHRTPLTTDSRPRTRHNRSGTPHAPTHASCVRHSATHAVTGTPAGRQRAHALMKYLDIAIAAIEYLWGRGKTLQPAPVHRPQDGWCTGER